MGRGAVDVVLAHAGDEEDLVVHDKAEHGADQEDGEEADDGPGLVDAEEVGEPPRWKPASATRARDRPNAGDCHEDLVGGGDRSYALRSANRSGRISSSSMRTPRSAMILDSAGSHGVEEVRPVRAALPVVDRYDAAS